MENGSRNFFSYDWGAVIPISIGLRSREISARVSWFINMRWMAVIACMGGTVCAWLRILPAELNPIYFLATTVFLAATNLVYTVVAGNLRKRQENYREARLLLGFQMIGDFITLGALTYICGSVETPIVTLFLAHIIMATLFFKRTVSIFIIGLAWVFASMPLILEWAEVLPVLSIFDSDFKQVVTDSFLLTGSMAMGIGGVFFACWYLVSVISQSLRLRERELREAHQLLLTLDREKTQATLRATHELKAPFAAIKSYVYTLRDGYAGELPEKAKTIVARIGERCDQLTNKITKIIYLSNVKSLVVTEMNIVPVDLKEILMEETAEGALHGKPRNISVDFFSSSNERVLINGSKSHLKMMFSNLVRNAINYSYDGGKVKIALELDSCFATVSISDQGIGIPKENLEKIFDEHFRSNNAVKHYQGGSGLGLAIVKEIARIHGASIQVSSEIEQGSRFSTCFTLNETRNKRGNHGENTNH